MFTNKFKQEIRNEYKQCSVAFTGITKAYYTIRRDILVEDLNITIPHNLRISLEIGITRLHFGREDKKLTIKKKYHNVVYCRICLIFYTNQIYNVLKYRRLLDL